MSTVTVNGTTYTSPDDFQGTAYKDTILALAGDMLADVGRALTTTSATTATVGTGSKTFVMATAVPFGVGAFVLIADNAAPTTNYMFGQVTARSGTTLDVTVAVSAGSGTLSDWTISISGARGAAGTLSGNASGAIDMNGYDLTVDFTTVEAAGEQAEENAANATGTVTIQATDPTVLRRTLTGDVTLHVAGAPTPGKGWSTELRTTQDGTGGRDLTILPANLLTYSEQFDNAAWNKSQSTVTADAIAAPDGQTSADKIIENGTTNGHSVFQTLSKDTSAITYTGDVFCKSAGRTQAWFWIYGASGGDRAQGIFDLSAGTVVSASVIGNFTSLTSSITDAGNGWWRIRMTVTSDNSSSVTFNFGPALSGSFSYPGDGSSGIYAWGAQLTESSDSLGCIAVGATRAASVVWRAGSGNAIDYTAQAAAAESRIILGIGSDGEIMVDNVSVEA
jgi:hypothetical protein